MKRIWWCSLYLWTLYLAPRDLDAQRVELRAGGVSRDTGCVLPADTVPLQAMGKTARNGTVVPTNVAFTQTAHCLGVAPSGARATLVERACGLIDGWVKVTATVSSTTVTDSIYVTRPKPPIASDLGLCLTWSPKALYYRARDTTIALAIHGADQRIAANFVPDSVAPHWSWQGARLLVQYSAIACMPGYLTRDVTRLSTTRWASANTQTATVDRYGLATWLTRRAPMVISAEWPVK